MLKLSTLLTVFICTLKAEAGDYGKGSYIPDVACDVRLITISQQANQSRLCLLEGGAL